MQSPIVPDLPLVRRTVPCDRRGVTSPQLGHLYHRRIVRQLRHVKELVLRTGHDLYPVRAVVLVRFGDLDLIAFAWYSVLNRDDPWVVNVYDGFDGLSLLAEYLHVDGSNTRRYHEFECGVFVGLLGYLEAEQSQASQR